MLLDHWNVVNAVDQVLDVRERLERVLLSVVHELKEVMLHADTACAYLGKELRCKNVDPGHLDVQT